MWRETSYVFTTPRGEPLNPRTGYTEWKRLLSAPACRSAGFTTYATQPRPSCCCSASRIALSWASWAGRRRPWLARYQHIIAAIRRDVATSVGRLLWRLAESPIDNALDLTDKQHGAIRLLLTTLPEPWCEQLTELFGDRVDGTAGVSPTAA